MADRDQKREAPESDSPSPVQLIGWTAIGAASGLGLYRAANDIVMGRASLGEAVVGGVALAAALLAVRRLARLLA